MSAARSTAAVADVPVSIAERIGALDWRGVEAALDAHGWAMAGPLLEPAECVALIGRYDDPALFRSRIVMARHNFGRGEYQYFDYPLPGLVEDLRREAYAKLAPIANRWAERLGLDVRHPGTLEAMLRRCHGAGQRRPTPLMLRYGAGDYNCLHQDLYGDCVFPLQLAILLSEPGRDFTGGEIVLTEQRPRMQSRAQVVALQQGQGLIFAVNQRPVRGTRGDYRVAKRHGVSTNTSGRRHTLCDIFHDAT